MQDASPKRQNFLIVGPAGSGKTSLFATIPGKKFVYVFDPNAVRTLEGLDIKYEEFLADELDLSIITMKGGTRDTATKTFNPETYQRRS
jgi:GTPase SAR1 family protein